MFNPYAGVKTSILLFDNVIAKHTNDILFMKVNNDGYDLGAQRRKIDKDDLPGALEELKAYKEYVVNGKATSSFTERIAKEKTAETVVIQHDTFTLVTKERIAEGGEYNLSGDRYRVTQDYSNAKWPMVELGEVCKVIRAVVYSKKDEADSGSKVLRANNINLNGELVLDDIKVVKKDFSPNQLLSMGDIVICLASGSKDHIGKVAYIYTNTDFYFGGFMGAIRTSSELNSKYLFYLLHNDHFNLYLREQIAGANINNLNAGILGRYKIPLPPLKSRNRLSPSWTATRQ